MAKYYATISGLPNIGVYDRKIPFSSAFFVKELEQELTPRDKKLFLYLRWEEENHFLIDFLEDPDHAREAVEQPTLFSFEELELVLEALKKKDRLPKNNLPPYFIPFLKSLLLGVKKKRTLSPKKRVAFGLLVWRINLLTFTILMLWIVRMSLLLSGLA